MSISDVSPARRLNEATPEEWDDIKADRYHDNRNFDLKDAECVLVKPVPGVPEGEFNWGPNSDPVNSPSHYTHGGDIECIDAIDAMLGHELSLAYYQASVVKYLWRWKYKGGVESLRKARWFLERMIKTEVKGG